MAEFRMPSLGADMDAGKLLEWYVKPGDAVQRGDIVALVDTDKAAIEVEIFEGGVIDELLVRPGQTVPVGTPLAHVRSGATGEAAAAAPAEEVTPEEARATKAAPEEAAPEQVAPPPAPAAAQAPLAVVPPHATPAARAQGREVGIDLSDLRGTGRHGVITREDVIAASKPRAQEAPETAPAAPPPVPVPPIPAPGGERLRITPRARRLARELGVDPAGVTGTGPDGAITGGDVQKASAPPAPPMPKPTSTPTASTEAVASTHAKPSDERYAAMRRAIAAAMAKSKREIPHYYLGHHIDMEAALTWLEERNLERSLPERILPATLLFRATALAVAEVPEMNGFFLDGRFEPRDAVHMGIGISLRQGGLIAPAILDAQDKGLSALMTSVRDLVGRTRTLQLRSSEMSEATITVTALGDQGVETVFGVIYPPQVALVGFGTVAQRPWAKNGMVGARRVVHVTLSADHRASDGHTGARFLAAIDGRLQHPEEL